MHTHIQCIKKFYPQAENLRNHFVQRMENPKETRSDRFVWDYWHVPNQYTLVRTPAYHYFPDTMYMSFHKYLVHWGRKHLGCWDITPPWLSYYINGCKQELHSDVPHGPWAFVFSLSPKKIKFEGGETLILRPQVLNYWQNFGTEKDRELNSFVQKIRADHNQLVVFDPRYPHGVTEVKGTQDPLESRLVIHGWFTQPKTYIEGPLPPKSTEKLLNQCFAQLEQVLANYPAIQGTLSLQLTVKTTGEVEKAQFLTNTLLDLQGQPPKDLNRWLLKIYSQVRFANARQKSSITIPLIFR